MTSIAKQLRRQLYRGNLLSFCIALIASLAAGSMNLLLSWIMQQLIDTASGTPGALPLATLLQLSCILVLLCIFFLALKCCFEPRFIRKAMEQYKEAAFQRLMQKNIASFRQESSSVYLSALTNDAANIETGYLEQQLSILTNAATFAGSLAMMLWYSPLLTLIALCITALPFLASVLTGGRLQAAEQKVSEKNSAFTASLSDCLGGFPVIKAFQAEKEISHLFSQSNCSLEVEKYRKLSVKLRIGLIGSVTGLIAQLGVFLIGAWMALAGFGITAGTVILFVNLMNFIIEPIASLPALFASRKAALGLIDKLSDALERNAANIAPATCRPLNVPSKENYSGNSPASDTHFCNAGSCSANTSGPLTLPKNTPDAHFQPSRDFPPASTDSSTLQEGISLENVSFSYEQGKEVLHQISTTFEAGKSYAIVGGNGSGKSTLHHLLIAGSSAYKGQILMDGKELRTLPPDFLYERISLIQQNVFVFNASIRDNVTMLRSFPEEEVQKALALAQLTGLVDKRSTDFLCGENGCNLSGGEKQRIAIARSLLKHSSILLADEATAALDAGTAFQVSANLLSLPNVTRIIVTHALNRELLGRYDKILVLKEGRLAESGSFQELMDRKGYFYALFTIAQ